MGTRIKQVENIHVLPADTRRVSHRDVETLRIVTFSPGDPLLAPEGEELVLKKHYNDVSRMPDGALRIHGPHGEFDQVGGAALCHDRIIALVNVMRHYVGSWRG